MPSQKQVRWSQLRVGLTVIFAAAVLAVLIFLMTGTTGLFTRKIEIKAYFDDAGGLREGAPVRLQGVDVGNVTDINIVPDRQLDPVEVVMSVAIERYPNIRKDSQVSIDTAGVLGESFVQINSQTASQPTAQTGDVLPSRDKPSIEDVVRSSQSTLENMQILLQRLDRVVATVERGEGSVGKFINDPTLYNKFVEATEDMRRIVDDMQHGKGTLGKLLTDEELYAKLNATVDNVNQIVAQIQAGEGSLGKFVKDPTLYDRAAETITKANLMMDKINTGQGTMGKLISDPELAKRIETTVDKLAIITERLERGEGTAGRLLQDPSLYVSADQALVETRNLLKAIREDPKKYLTIKFRIF